MSLPSLKVAASTAKVAPKPVRKTKIVYDDEEEEEEPIKPIKTKESTGSFTSLLKASLKDKVENKLKEKEPKKVISFPKDKPTYDITMLE